MIDVRVFRNPRFSAASGVLTLTSFALYGSVFLLIQYFQFVLGYSPLEAGLLATPVAVGMMVMSPNAPTLRAALGHEAGGRDRPAGGRRGHAALRLQHVMSSFVGGCAVRLLFGIGLGLTSAPATESIMGSLPPSRAGVGSAINDTTRQTGGALGVAIIGSVFLAAYHHFADKAQHLSAASSAALHDSVGRALELARDLPAKQGAALVELSRQAFVDAMRITYPIAAAFIVFAAFIAWRYLPAHGQRRVRDRRRLRRSARGQRVRDPRRIEVRCVRAVPVVEPRRDPRRGGGRRRARHRGALRARAGRAGWAAARFPWATFVVNMVGSFVLGIALTALADERGPPRRRCGRSSAVGFCGGLTTFSTWMVESVLLTRDGDAGDRRRSTSW